MRGSGYRILGLVLVVALIGGVLLWLSLVRKARSSDNPPPVLRFCLEGRLVTFDPHLHDESATWTTLCNLFDGLVRFDANLKIEPALAESWSNPDETHWLFQLRPRVRFHTNRPVMAEDVVFSIRRAAFYEHSVLRPYLTSIRAVTTPAPERILIETREPDPLLLNKLTFVFVVPYSPTFDVPALANRPVGTGPYRFDHWRTEKCFVLRKNPGYWGKPALFPSVEISHIHEEADRVAALLAGEADLTRGLRWQEHQRINDTSGYHSKVANSLTVMLLALNIGRIPGEADNPLSRREVRRAIHLALDRQELVRRGFGGLARPAWQLVPPEVFGYDRNVTGGEHDPEKTRILLRAAGYPGGFGMDLFVSSSSRLLGEAIRDSLAPVGIRVRVRLLPWDDLYRRFLSDHPPQAATFGWSCNSGDESDFLDTCLHSRTRAEGGGMGELNATGLVLPELDRLIVESRHVMRVQDRLEILGRINRLALEELPYIPLTIDPEIYGYVDGLSWEPRIDTRIYLHELRWQPKR